MQEFIKVISIKLPYIYDFGTMVGIKFSCTY